MKFTRQLHTSNPFYGFLFGSFLIGLYLKSPWKFVITSTRSSVPTSSEKNTLGIPGYGRICITATDYDTRTTLPMYDSYLLSARLLNVPDTRYYGVNFGSRFVGWSRSVAVEPVHMVNMNDFIHLLSSLAQLDIYKPKYSVARTAVMLAGEPHRREPANLAELADVWPYLFGELAVPARVVVAPRQYVPVDVTPASNYTSSASLKSRRNLLKAQLSHQDKELFDLVVSAYGLDTALDDWAVNHIKWRIAFSEQVPETQRVHFKKSQPFEGEVFPKSWGPEGENQPLVID